MALQNQGAPGFTFAGFLILAALGSFLWTSHDPKSNRPLSNNDIDPVKLEEGDIPARLWQDPYQALDKFLKNTENNSRIQNLSFNQHSLHRRIIDHSKKAGLTVLGVMVDTDPYAESEERRRQRRYAVVSALGETGYVPDEEKLIHAVRLDGFYNKEYNVKPKSKKSVNLQKVDPDKAVFPYEWYEHEFDKGKYPCVLVIWLDETKFSKEPIKSFEKLANNFKIKGAELENITLKILGPASSTTLKRINSKFDEVYSSLVKKGGDSDENLGGFHLLSPVATMEDDLLYPNNQPTLGEKVEELRNKTKKNISFTRTIRTDRVLAHELVKELQKRRIPPHRQNDEDPLKKGSVVLISEWDTAFGRSLPRSFMKEFCQSGANCQRVIRYSYLRGIDGIAPGTKDLGQTTSRGSNKNSGKDTVDGSAKNIRRPVGTGQYDYIQRLANEIRDIDRKRYLKYGKGVVAVGILGSDVYDKLMILKILRSKLPSSTFFTTDMDSQLLHPSDFDWTRNMIVASSFGLRLSPEIQTHTPPFRNSYQTSMFLSTLLAVKYKCPEEECEILNFSQNMLNEAIVPVLAEVGRDGPVVLNRNALNAAEEIIQGNNMPSVKGFYPNSGPSNGSNIAILYFFTAAIIIFAWAHVQYRWKELLAWLLVSMFVFASVTCVAITSSADEPFSFTNGTSAWPAFYIRLLAILLSIFFVRYSMKQLNKSRDKLSEKYFGDVVYFNNLSSHSNDTTSQLVTDVLKRIKMFLMVNKVAIKSAFSIILFFILTMVIFLKGRKEATISDPTPIIIISLSTLAIWFAFVYLLFKLHSINGWKKSLDLKQKDKQVIDVIDYWHEYKRNGAFFHRLLRSLSMVLIYFAFAVSVFLFFGNASNPIRGDLGVLRIIMILSVSLMLFMIFFVVDATRLCITWIDGLTDNQFNWDKSKIDDFDHDLTQNKDVTVLWMKMHMIAERTQVVGELIYFPFIIIVLMLVSRVSYFEHWGFPQALAIVVFINVAIATSNGFRLRYAAERARNKILDKLNSCYIYAQGQESTLKRQATSQAKNIRFRTSTAAEMPSHPPAKQIKAMIENIQNLREGAYKPFLEQPVVRAFILLLGGIGFSISQYSNALN